MADTLQALEAIDNVTCVARCMGAGVYDHGYALACERLSDHLADKSGPRHRLWRIRAAQIITASGAIEPPLSFAGNDVPGVMLASAVRDYVVNFGTAAGARTVIVTNNDDAHRTAIALKQAGLAVPAIIDARVSAGPLAQTATDLGIRILYERGVASLSGTARVTGVAVCAQNGVVALL